MALSSRLPATGTHPDRRYVVVCVDGTRDGERALRYGVSEAQRRHVGLRLIHVQAQTVGLAPMLPAVSVETLHEVAAEVVKAAEQAARDYGWHDPDLDVVLASGPRREAILAYTADAVCIVVGRRSSTVDHLLTGSTTSSLAAHSDAPVISVPEAWDSARRRGLVVVGVDACDCDETRAVVTAAFAEARTRHADLELLHAWRPTGAYDAAIGTRVLEDQWTECTRQALTDQVHALGCSTDVEWQPAAQFAPPATALYRDSSHADLVVVGRHGHHSSVHRSLGATARTALRTARCPVLVVPTSPH